MKRKCGREENVIVLEEESKVVVDNEEADIVTNSVTCFSPLHWMTERMIHCSQRCCQSFLSDPKGFQPDVALQHG